jgi:hypothetical protein
VKSQMASSMKQSNNWRIVWHHSHELLNNFLWVASPMHNSWLRSHKIRDRMARQHSSPHQLYWAPRMVPNKHKSVVMDHVAE